MSKLVISPQLTLPVDAVTQTFVIFGKRGAGKTNTAVVLAEEMYRFAPIVVLTPLDNWWGLKASFDGNGPGLGVYVFGGAHGDLPLEPGAGELMADTFIEYRMSMVLCTKGWTVGERGRFVAAFAKRLLDKNAGVPIHVFIEEADAFVPQRPMKGEEAMLGEMDRLVRWGRGEGIGATLITQRSAKVNKDVTTQAETLIAHRTTGPQDRDAIDDWIKFHAGGEERQRILSSLPELPDGTAWIWSPEWLQILEKVKVRRRKTFDSASTPKVGEKRPEPKKLADVDLEKLRGRLASTIEKAKADDPRELRNIITALRREIATLSKARDAATTPKVEVRVEYQQTMVRPKSWRRTGDAITEIVRSAEKLKEAATELRRELDHLPPINDNMAKAPLQGRVAESVERAGAGAERPSRSSSPAVQARPVPPADKSNGHHQASGPQQRILDALYWLESVRIPQARKVQLALLADASPKSSAYTNNLGTLRTAGFITYPGPGLVALTARGRSQAREDLDVPTTSEGLHRQLFSRLSGPQVRILQQLIKLYPESIEKAELAEKAEASATSSAFTNNLGALRSLGLIDYPAPGQVAALPVLFLEEAAVR